MITGERLLPYQFCASVAAWSGVLFTPSTYLAALGAAGVGIPFALAHVFGWADGNLEGAYFEYGNTFTLVAGLLNLLAVLDAFDVAIGRR